MGTLNAITNNALLSIVEWGEGALRAPVAGETAWVLTNISNVDQIVIAANRPLYTKVVASVATEMTQQEKEAVDAVLNPIQNAANTDVLLATLNSGVEYDYGTVTAAFTLDIANGNGLTQKVTLGADLTTAGDISIKLSDGPRKVVLRIDQDGTGGREIDVSAWVVFGGGTVHFPKSGAPTFSSELAGEKRFLVLDYRSGTEIFIWASAEVFV